MALQDLIHKRDVAGVIKSVAYSASLTYDSQAQPNTEFVRGFAAACQAIAIGCGVEEWLDDRAPGVARADPCDAPPTDGERGAAVGFSPLRAWE